MSLKTTQSFFIWVVFTTSKLVYTQTTNYFHSKISTTLYCFVFRKITKKYQCNFLCLQKVFNFAIIYRYYNLVKNHIKNYKNQYAIYHAIISFFLCHINYKYYCRISKYYRSLEMKAGDLDLGSTCFKAVHHYAGYFQNQFWTKNIIKK